MAHIHHEGHVDRFAELTPELAAAFVTIAVAILARYQSLAPLPLLVGDSALAIAAAVTIIIAAAIGIILRGRSAFLKFVTCLVVTLLGLVGTATSLQWWQTRPGREARNDASAWRNVPYPRIEHHGRVSAGRSQYGTGYADVMKNEVDIHVDSRKSNLIAYFPTPFLGSHFYSEVTAQRVEGSSIGTACALSFGYRSAKSFYQVALRFDGVQLARFEGAIPARVFTGPVPVPYATDLDAPHRLAVLRDGKTVIVFVDDHRVFERDLPRFDGGTTFGTLDIGTGYTEDAQCNFTHWLVRQRINH